jgi:hypothetical protein
LLGRGKVLILASQEFRLMLTPFRGERWRVGNLNAALFSFLNIVL